jgi:hypothetical protein
VSTAACMSSGKPAIIMPPASSVAASARSSRPLCFSTNQVSSRRCTKSPPCLPPDMACRNLSLMLGASPASWVRAAGNCARCSATVANTRTSAPAAASAPTTRAGLRSAWPASCLSSERQGSSGCKVAMAWPLVDFARTSWAEPRTPRCCWYLRLCGRGEINMVSALTL